MAAAGGWRNVERVRHVEKALQRNSLPGEIFNQSGRRDLNSTAPIRGRCFIGTYMREWMRIGNYWLLWSLAALARGHLPKPICL